MPVGREVSQVNSSEGKRVRCPTSRAMTWSMEMPAWMSVALFFTRTPVRKVPLARAWSPPPSFSGLALRSSSPPRIWRFLRRGCQRLQGLAQLEILFIARRPPGAREWRRWENRETPSASGAPVAVVGQVRGWREAAKSLPGENEANAGSATHAPNPRRKWRRVKLARRCRLEVFAGSSGVFHGVNELMATGLSDGKRRGRRRTVLRHF